MKKVLGIYRQILQTFNPSSYDGFAESKIKNTLNYYTAMTFNLFLILIILLIPTAVQLPQTVETYFDSISELNFNGQFETSQPLMFPKENPVLVINYNNETPTTPAPAIFNNGILHYGFLMNEYQIDFTPLKDAKTNKTEFSNFVSVVILLMLPTLLLIMYFYEVIKFFVIIVITAIIAKIISEIVRYRTDFKKLFNCAVYGSTATILLDFIFFAYGIWFYYIQYLPLVIFLIVGISQHGEKVVSEKNRKYVEVK